MAQAKPHKLIWLQTLAANTNKAYSMSVAEDLSSFGYFQRSTVREHLMFASRTSSERCEKGSRVTISLKEVPFVLHVYRKVDGLTGVAVTDQSYSERVAQSLITKMLGQFEKKYGNNWKKCIRDTPHPFEPIKGFLKEYADPNKADKMSAVQENLDQIKSIMHKNIEDVKFYNSTLLLLCEFAGIHNL